MYLAIEIIGLKNYCAWVQFWFLEHTSWLELALVFDISQPPSVYVCMMEPGAIPAPIMPKPYIRGMKTSSFFHSGKFLNVGIAQSSALLVGGWREYFINSVIN